MEFKIKLGKKTIDLSKAMPLTIGDWKAFERLEIVTKDGNMGVAGATQVCALLLHLAQKVDKGVSEKDIEAIPLEELPRLTKWVDQIMKIEQEVKEEDHPS